MRFVFRAECEKLHLQQRPVCQLSDRRVLACSIDLLGRGDERIHFARSEDELPAQQRHLFCQSFERNDQHFVHHPLFELDRFRWHQRLLALQSVADSPPARKAYVYVHLVAWTSDRLARSLVGFSASPSMDVRLPIDDDSDSTLVYLSMRVRDPYGCSFEYDMPPVSIKRDTTIIEMLIGALQSTSSHSDATHQLNSNEIVQLLVNGNQNDMNQALVSLSQLLNTMSTRALMSAANVSAITLSVSSLDHTFISQSMNTTSVPTDYNQQRNQVAMVLDYLMPFVSNLSVGGIDSITLQSSTLAELTRSTSALTRDAMVSVFFTVWK